MAAVLRHRRALSPSGGLLLFCFLADYILEELSLKVSEVSTSLLPQCQAQDTQTRRRRCVRRGGGENSRRRPVTAARQSHGRGPTSTGVADLLSLSQEIPLLVKGSSQGIEPSAQPLLNRLLTSSQLRNPDDVTVMSSGSCRAGLSDYENMRCVLNKEGEAGRLAHVHCG